LGKSYGTVQELKEEAIKEFKMYNEPSSLKEWEKYGQKFHPIDEIKDYDMEPGALYQWRDEWYKEALERINRAIRGGQS